MKFRLTYQGLLLSENNKGSIANSRATHKHQIRKAMHPQLKKLWEVMPLFQRHKKAPSVPRSVLFGALREPHTIEGLSSRFSLNQYRFVPLITRTLGAVCAIDVLFLRSEPPGSIFARGDIDNRLKTLFDGLTMPADALQLGDYQNPDIDEDPFFCLLEDDSLIIKASVETDTLLQPINDVSEENSARVLITVTTSLVDVRGDNIGYA